MLSPTFSAGTPTLLSTLKQQVRHGGILRILQVPPAFQRARATARQQRGQRIVIVDIAIAQAASIEQGGVIEQIAVAIRRGFELVQELGEQTSDDNSGS